MAAVSRQILFAVSCWLAGFTLLQAAVVGKTPPPPYPEDAYNRGEHGIILLDVLFGQGGAVSAVNIKETNAPKDLTTYAVNFISKNWLAPQYAGMNIHVPIAFMLPKVNMDRSRIPLMPPAYPFYALEHGEHGTVKLHLEWDHQGHIRKCVVASSSGSRYLDEYTANFVIVNWNAIALADHDEDVPFTFNLPSQAPTAAPKEKASASGVTIGGQPRLPCPPFPIEALKARQGGSLLLEIQWDAKGKVTACRVVSATGLPMLRDWTQRYILTHWDSPSMAGKKVTMPITYKPPEL